MKVDIHSAAFGTKFGYMKVRIHEKDIDQQNHLKHVNYSIDAFTTSSHFYSEEKAYQQESVGSEYRSTQAHL